MRIALLTASWFLGIMGSIAFFAEKSTPGAILAGASLIAIAIAQSKRPGPPPSESRD